MALYLSARDWQRFSGRSALPETMVFEVQPALVDIAPQFEIGEVGGFRRAAQSRRWWGEHSSGGVVQPGLRQWRSRGFNAFRSCLGTERELWPTFRISPLSSTSAPSPGCAGYSPDIPPHEAGFAGTPVAGESVIEASSARVQAGPGHLLHGPADDGHVLGADLAGPEGDRGPGQLSSMRAVRTSA